MEIGVLIVYTLGMFCLNIIALVLAIIVFYMALNKALARRNQTAYLIRNQGQGGVEA